MCFKYGIKQTNIGTSKIQNANLFKPSVLYDLSVPNQKTVQNRT